jgi:lipopolysaccharide/colanic/teichoic acid biosynthesis glycosyltransferase
MLSRLLDILLSGLAILALSPVFIFVMVTLRLTGEGEVFFLQDRIGRNGKIFKLYKFVTMVKDSPNIGTGTVTLQNDPRVLPVGRFLRKSKLNELPQLFNILLGDMAIIGPRPQTPRCFAAFPHDAQERLKEVRPGLSGIGSIIFRDEESLLSSAASTNFYDHVIMPYKGEVECWYIDRKSVLLDLSLILLTALAVTFPRHKLAERWLSGLPKPPPQLAHALAK